LHLKGCGHRRRDEQLVPSSGGINPADRHRAKPHIGDSTRDSDDQ
jgi:hypothetical protein